MSGSFEVKTVLRIHLQSKIVFLLNLHNQSAEEYKEQGDVVKRVKKKNCTK